MQESIEAITSAIGEYVPVIIMACTKTIEAACMGRELTDAELGKIIREVDSATYSFMDNIEMDPADKEMATEELKYSVYECIHEVIEETVSEMKRRLHQQEWNRKN